MSVTRYVLTQTACALLALPSGWCCLLPLAAAPAPVAEADTDCCSSCCKKPKPPGEEAPTREPMAVCCCENLVPLKDDGGVKVTPDAFVTAHFTADRPAGSGERLTRPVVLSLSPPRPLHVLRCLWLC
jgi:hypothetical protein